MDSPTNPVSFEVFQGFDKIPTEILIEILTFFSSYHFLKKYLTPISSSFYHLIHSNASLKNAMCFYQSCGAKELNNDSPTYLEHIHHNRHYHSLSIDIYNNWDARPFTKVFATNTTIHQLSFHLKFLVKDTDDSSNINTMMTSVWNMFRTNSTDRKSVV
jgi:hypothetical protein